MTDRTYVMTSPRFSGDVTFRYDAAGILRQYINRGDMSEGQLAWMHEHFPLTLDALQALAGASPTLRIREVKKDLSFEAFWNAYAYKVGHKDRCKRLWEELSEADRLRAMDSLQRYQSYLDRTNMRKTYPETYIAQRRFENEF